ncbi:MAG: SseB family protein, partial [Paracoccaceae bacterium]
MTGKSRLEVLAEELRRFPADQSARMRFFNAFCDAEVFLLLNEEPDEGSLSPVVLEAEGRGHVLAFASEEHLADYSAQVAPYAALSGR